MKTIAFLLLLLLSAFTGWSEDLLITALGRDGNLCWTNSRPDAGYWLQYAFNPKGPWKYLRSYHSPTYYCLNGIERAGNKSSFNLSDWLGAEDFKAFMDQPGQLYLRLATDAPPPPPWTNIFDLKVYDYQSKLIVTGRWECVFAYTNSYTDQRGFEAGATMTGTQFLEAVGSITNEFVKKWMVGQGPIEGNMNIVHPMVRPMDDWSNWNSWSLSEGAPLVVKFGFEPSGYWHGTFNAPCWFPRWTSCSGTWSTTTFAMGFSSGFYDSNHGTFTATALTP